MHREPTIWASLVGTVGITACRQPELDAGGALTATLTMI